MHMIKKMLKLFQFLLNKGKQLSCIDSGACFGV